jgi:hypothetical protein
MALPLELTYIGGWIVEICLLLIVLLVPSGLVGAIVVVQKGDFGGAL